MISICLSNSYLMEKTSQVQSRFLYLHLNKPFKTNNRLTLLNKIWDNAEMVDNGAITAAAIGHVAYEILQNEINANVCGNTSKGLFAVTDKKRILFISHQKFKGPLTVNINRNLLAHQAPSHNGNLLLSPNRIKFIQTAMEIKINSQTHVWTPLILNKMDFNPEAFINRSRLIEHEMIRQLSDNESDFTSCNIRNIANQGQAQEIRTNI